jgi:hypothetical protein
MEFSKTESYLNEYTYYVEWSRFERKYLSRCVEFPRIVCEEASHGEAMESIRLYVENLVYSQEFMGSDLPIPFTLRKFNGNFKVHVDPTVHKLLIIESSKRGVPLNKFIQTVFNCI